MLASRQYSPFRTTPILVGSLSGRFGAPQLPLHVHVRAGELVPGSVRLPPLPSRWPAGGKAERLAFPGCGKQSAAETVGLRGDQFVELVPVFERVFGAEQRDTLVGRSRLARWTGEAGDPAGARDRFIELVPVFERVLGPKHHNTLTAHAQLAWWTGEASGGQAHY
jgi:hypothetical protein